MDSEDEIDKALGMEDDSKLKPTEKYMKMRECCWDTISAYEFCGLLLSDMWIGGRAGTVDNMIRMFCIVIDKFDYVVDKCNLKIFFLGRQLLMNDQVPKEATERKKIYIVDFVMNRYFILMLDLGAVKPQLVRYNIESARPLNFYS